MFVRLAMPEDVETIITLGRMNTEETLPGQPYSEERVARLLYDYFETANPTFFVVEERRRVIGFLMSRMCKFDHRDGFYTTQGVLFVLPEKRGSRAAVLLMKELVRWSEMLGADAIRGGNDNSFRSERTAGFLEHFGFERVGIAMEKWLDHGR